MDGMSRMAGMYEALSEEEDSNENQADEHVKTFFVTLAAKGKDAWNAWMNEPQNRDLRVTFAGIDFFDAPKDRINFAGFEFGNSTDFSRCRWRGAYPGKDPHAFSPGSASFIDARFGNWVTFEGAFFGMWASFNQASFGESANFSGVVFDEYALFVAVSFGSGARFQGAAFNGLTSFDSAVFGNWAEFDYTVFKDRLIFTSSAPKTFSNISFSHASFYEEADFSGRRFGKIADFTSARFYTPPTFETGNSAAKIDFTSAKIGFARPGKLPWTSDSKIPLRLRAMRKLAEETKNHDLERDLYIEERKAERGVYWHQLVEQLGAAPLRKKPLIFAQAVSHSSWVGVMFVYWALADYGRSFMRPLFWLVVSLMFFYVRYLRLLWSHVPSAGTLDAEKYDRAARMIALGNSVPFIGPLTIDAEIKKFLFCPAFGKCLPIPPDGFQFLVITQNFVSIGLIFFIGLSLRNYFKIR